MADVVGMWMQDEYTHSWTLVRHSQAGSTSVYDRITVTDSEAGRLVQVYRQAGPSCGQLQVEARIASLLAVIDSLQAALQDAYSRGGVITALPQGREGGT